jgi:hypothetical protein
MSVLHLTITDRAKVYMANLLRSSPKGSLPALFFGSERRYDKGGRLVKEAAPHWSMNVYDQVQAERLDRDFSTKGFRVIYRVGELTLCVAQPQLVAELEGKTLDVEGGNVCVR